MIIRTYRNKGIHLTNEEGITFSIQFGEGNYCENYTKNVNINSNQGVSSSDCEVAVWDKEGKWITERYFKGANQVKGYVPIEEALRIALRKPTKLEKL